MQVKLSNCDQVHLALNLNGSSNDINVSPKRSTTKDDTHQAEINYLENKLS